VINIALWLAGVALLVLGVWRLRPPLGRMQELDRLADNAKRYDAWRGGSRTAAGGESGTTGADVMRAVLRRQVIVWAVVAVIGVVLIVAGFAVR
jgi:hypothetical protein